MWRVEIVLFQEKLKLLKSDLKVWNKETFGHLLYIEKLIKHI